MEHLERHGRVARVAKGTAQELNEQTIDRITRVVRSLADDRVERGIELSRPMHCDSCDRDTSPAGGALYGAYKLCNDCLLDFTLALASGRSGNIADFMTKRDDTPAPTDLNTPAGSVSVRPLQSRDKLMPSNEPC